MRCRPPLTLKRRRSRERRSGVRRGTKQEAAVLLLLELLADGDWHLSGPILDELARRGLNAAVGHRAAHAVGVEHRKRSGRRGRFEWRIAPGAPPPVRRDETAKSEPPREPAAPAREVCVFCNAPIPDPRAPKRFCDARCRTEGHRLARILAGDEDAEYRSVAARLAVVGLPSARERRTVTADRSPAVRLLADAGLERRHDGGDR